MENPKVLIADDEADLALMLSVRLRAAGLETRVAGDGEAALAAALAWTPDVVLTDVSMPKLDGWQLCAALRGDPRLREVPVLAMTAWITPDLERRAQQAGADGLLLKPFDERKLADVLKKAASAGRCAHEFIRA